MFERHVRKGATVALLILIISLLLASFPALREANAQSTEKSFLEPSVPLRVLGFYYSISEGELKLAVKVALPNPCYKIAPLDAKLEKGRKIVLEALLASPDPRVFCIQVVRIEQLQYTMPLPPSGEYDAYLTVKLRGLEPRLGAPYYEFYLGKVIIPAGQPSPKPSPSAEKYQGLLLKLVGEWSGAEGYWLYEARVRGFEGRIQVALPLEVRGGLPAGFAGLGHVEQSGDGELVVLYQVAVYK